MASVIVLGIGSVLGWVVVIVGLVRNDMVYNYRNKVLYDSNYTTEECLQRLHCLPSYERMVWLQWWRRDWSDYLERKREP